MKIIVKFLIVELEKTDEDKMPIFIHYRSINQVIPIIIYFISNQYFIILLVVFESNVLL